MTFGIIIVIGFMIAIGVTGVTIMHYLTKAMVSRDAEIIDPKPETRF
ncbi:MAG: hypothetical protein R3328_03870 [Planococcaceae bacterium]|nr:hypothetical protein [Bacillota bacterium]MDX1770642.1 hypothetical protein [Planococcaceae bacterium]